MGTKYGNKNPTLTSGECRYRIRENAGKEQLRTYEKVCVALSGGVDSTLMTLLAVEALGRERVHAVIVDAPFTIPEETARAEQLCREQGIVYEIIRFDSMPPVFYENPPDRCYHCKKIIFTAIIEYARRHGITQIVDGTNADDTQDYRPGMKALQELGVASPLKDNGFMKAEVRILLQERGSRIADEPSSACLASRIPYGTPVTEKILQKVYQAEKMIRSFGIRQCRVRHQNDTLVRIEVAAAVMERLVAEPVRTAIITALKSLGYLYITIDLEGYRTGSASTAYPLCPSKEGEKI